ncbi:MAG TPA: lysophospholipid acyltransferase family protein [Mariniphaga sp.]|nr:lysophospholipid acyltransferase family protein [Mariniphaga sp.]
MGIFLLKCLAKLPFRFLYMLSGIVFFVIYRMIGYRRKVVIDNLKNAFPQKTDKEIKQISKRFYKHFSDLSIETIKLSDMDKQDFDNRVKVKHTHFLKALYKQGKSVVVLTMHYNNWEWSSCIPLHLHHIPVAVYKPLHNKKFNTYMNRIRSGFGAEMIPTDKVLRRVLESVEKNEVISLWLAGDQTPPLFHKFWLPFLNRQTLFYKGPAAIARRFNFPVVFQKIEKNGRGKYTITFELLIANPAEFDEQEIMNIYIQKMEEVIKEQPEYYLWSHKRWKHQPPSEIPGNY